ncbi:type IV pilus modification PilV family protein [Fredinandcohnia humi]
MIRFDKIREQKGVTLIELLITLTVSAIAIGAIYGVFITGIKAFQKIGIESGLRDEGDYILGMIINEMNRSSVDFISDCDGSDINKCIELIDNRTIEVEGELVEEGESVLQRVIRFEIDNSMRMSVTENGTLLESTTISSGTTVLTGSEISFACTNYEYTESVSDNLCVNAIVNMNLVINHSAYQDSMLRIPSLELESRFGF